MSKIIDIKFAFYVSGNATRLIKIIEQYPAILERTFLVVNDEAPNLKLGKLLLGEKIEYHEFQYKEKDLKGQSKNIYLSELLLKKFKEKNIDYSFCFGGKILCGQLLTVYKNKIINFHPAVLPMFPGVKSIDQALNANTFLLGNTAHFIDEGVDTGPVIMQSVIHREHFNDYDDVLDHQLAMINQIYTWILDNRLVIENKKVRIKNAIYKKITFYPNLENR